MSIIIALLSLLFIPIVGCEKEEESKLVCEDAFCFNYNGTCRDIEDASEVKSVYKNGQFSHYEWRSWRVYSSPKCHYEYN